MILLRNRKIYRLNENRNIQCFICRTWLEKLRGYCGEVRQVKILKKISCSQPQLPTNFTFMACVWQTSTIFLVDYGVVSWCMSGEMNYSQNHIRIYIFLVLSLNELSWLSLITQQTLMGSRCHGYDLVNDLVNWFQIL